MTNELTDVRCSCGDEYPADSYDAGFIAGSGMCQNCDAALPPKDICTCPSGDGSLRHPCPAHPAVEQAGGDERAAFEAWMHTFDLSPQLDGETFADERYLEAACFGQFVYDDPLTQRCWAAWKARAALAIASSAQTEHERDTLGQALGECIEAAGITTPGTPLTGPQLLMFAKDLKRDLKRAALAQPSPASNLDPHAEAFNEAPAEALKSEQAEAERPEVASLTADLYEIAERILEIAEGRPKAISTTLMAPVRDYRLKDAKAVARVMGERLVALADRYVHHDRVAGALRFERQQMDRSFTACINERDAANARLHEVATACATAEQERDAALARIAELERKLSNEENAHTTTIEQRDNAEHWADQLANAIAERFGVDIGEHSNLNCPWNEALVWMQQPPAQAQHSAGYAEARMCANCRHIGINDAGADGNCPECGGFYELEAQANVPSQAQHSVPEGVTIERDVAGTIHIKVGDFDFIQLQYQRPYTDNASTWKLAERIASLLAAAPGKEEV